MIINTTTTSTSHPIDLQNCNTNYTASVAAVSQDYKGDAEVIMKRTPGGGKSCEVQYYNTCFSSAFV